MKFYYTFGTDPQFPYRGGWVEVIANDRTEADVKFKSRFPDKSPGTLNCSSIHTEESFSNTESSRVGNLGAFCHEVIGYPKKYTGNKVKVRKDIEVGKEYGGITVCKEMAECFGKEAHILLCDSFVSDGKTIEAYTLDICDKRWTWTEAMFE